MTANIFQVYYITSLCKGSDCENSGNTLNKKKNKSSECLWVSDKKERSWVKRFLVWEKKFPGCEKRSPALLWGETWAQISGLVSWPSCLRLLLLLLLLQHQLTGASQFSQFDFGVLGSVQRHLAVLPGRVGGAFMRLTCGYLQETEDYSWLEEEHSDWLSIVSVREVSG